ncbi:MAG: hypothetical protein ACOYMG_04105 [Candidatus Methylumidiphilus sp.]
MWVGCARNGKGKTGSRIGAIPNRFMAKVPAGFQGEAFLIDDSIFQTAEIGRIHAKVA